MEQPGAITQDPGSTSSRYDTSMRYSILPPNQLCANTQSLSDGGKKALRSTVKMGKIRIHLTSRGVPCNRRNTRCVVPDKKRKEKKRYIIHTGGRSAASL